MPPFLWNGRVGPGTNTVLYRVSAPGARLPAGKAGGKTLNLYEIFEKWEEKEISQKEYYSIFNQFCGNAKPVEIDWKRIDEYGT